MNIRTVLPPGFATFEQWQKHAATPYRPHPAYQASSVYPVGWNNMSNHERFKVAADNLLTETNKRYSVTTKPQ